MTLRANSAEVTRELLGHLAIERTRIGIMFPMNRRDAYSRYLFLKVPLTVKSVTGETELPILSLLRL